METNQQKKAWEAFRDELNRRIHAGPRGTVTELAVKLGTTRGTVSKWASGALKGERMSFDKMAWMLSAVGLDTSLYFGKDPLREDVEYTRIPWLEATASMGGGSVETSRSVAAHLAFRTDWLRAKGPLKGMVVVNASGDSMSPTIPDCSVVLVNEQDARPVNNGIFFVCYGEEVYLKRLRVDPRGTVTHLISDNDGYAMPLEPEVYFQVIGRAVWFGKEL